MLASRAQWDLKETQETQVSQAPQDQRVRKEILE